MHCIALYCNYIVLYYITVGDVLFLITPYYSLLLIYRLHKSNNLAVFRPTLIKLLSLIGAKVVSDESKMEKWKVKIEEMSTVAVFYIICFTCYKWHSATPLCNNFASPFGSVACLNTLAYPASSPDTRGSWIVRCVVWPYAFCSWPVCFLDSIMNSSTSWATPVSAGSPSMTRSVTVPLTLISTKLTLRRTSLHPEEILVLFPDRTTELNSRSYNFVLRSCPDILCSHMCRCSALWTAVLNKGYMYPQARRYVS